MHDRIPVHFFTIRGLQSIPRDVAHNASHPRRLDPTVELIKYSFVLYLQHGRHDVKCKPSMVSKVQSMDPGIHGSFSSANLIKY